MLLRDMSHHALSFGQFHRTDGETFVITSTLYEMPDEYDYWRAHYDSTHAHWGLMTFQLIIPKQIAPDVEDALAIVGGGALAQVQCEMSKAGAHGRDCTWCPSTSGWFLIG